MVKKMERKSGGPSKFKEQQRQIQEKERERKKQSHRKKIREK